MQISDINASVANRAGGNVLGKKGNVDPKDKADFEGYAAEENAGAEKKEQISKMSTQEQEESLANMVFGFCKGVVMKLADEEQKSPVPSEE